MVPYMSGKVCLGIKRCLGQITVCAAHPKGVEQRRSWSFYYSAYLMFAPNCKSSRSKKWKPFFVWTVEIFAMVSIFVVQTSAWDRSLVRSKVRYYAVRCRLWSHSHVFIPQALWRSHSSIRRTAMTEELVHYVNITGFWPLDHSL